MSSAFPPLLAPSPCSASNFSIDLGNTRCPDLTWANSSSVAACANACCGSKGTCETWQWCPAGEPCSRGYWYESGEVLVAGFDRPGTPLRNVTLEAAQAACDNDDLCTGLTYHSSTMPRGKQQTVYLKGAGSGARADPEWSTLYKARSGCFLGLRSVRCANSTAGSGWVSRALPPPQYTRGFIAAAFGDHMVLQRAPLASVIWGATTPGARVTSTFDGKAYVTIADANGVWRQQLPPTPASTTPRTLTFVGERAGESATLRDVLFGDVYVCGGQSNMVFATSAITNASAEIASADLHPSIRLFTVGQKTQAEYPAPDLQTVEQPWAVASRATISDGQRFGYFSAVCYVFGRRLADSLRSATHPPPLKPPFAGTAGGGVTRTEGTGGPPSRAGTVPIGLISSNWGGTAIEAWSPADAFPVCNRSEDSGVLYNAMIHPLTVGPLSLSGLIWYQGEQNTADERAARDYACLFPAMIRSWRAALRRPDLFFGFVQLSTWCPPNPAGLASMRAAQMSALALSNVGYATNADHGFGCNIHPPSKQFCAERLATAALDIVYKQPGRVWRGPTVDVGAARDVGMHWSASCTASGQATVRLPLTNTSGRPLELRQPSNVIAGLDCAALNRKIGGTCAWLNVSGLMRSRPTSDVGNATEGGAASAGAAVPFAANASVSELSGGHMGISWPCAPAQTFDVGRVEYGWGSIPMLSVYDSGSDLPLLPFALDRTAAPSRDVAPTEGPSSRPAGDETAATKLPAGDGTALRRALRSSASGGEDGVASGGDAVTRKQARQLIAKILAQLNGASHGALRWLVSTADVGRSPSHAAAGGSWFFNSDDGVHGAELWTSDLTALGTRLVRDIHPGAADSYPHSLCEFAGLLYFAADDGSVGVELWRSDGTAAGTELAVDVQPGKAGSHPNALTACNGRLFFGAADETHGYEMRALSSDGTAAVLLHDTTPGSGSSSVSNVECKTSTKGDPRLFYLVGTEATGTTHWVSDGTPEGTRPVESSKAEL